MRRFFAFALLVTAAVPAIAGPDTDDPARKFGGHAKSQSRSDDDGGRRPAWVGGQGGMSSAQGDDSAPRRRMGSISRTDQESTAPQPVRRVPRSLPQVQAGETPNATQPVMQRGGFSERLRQYRETHTRIKDGVATTDGNAPRPTNNSPVRSTLSGQHAQHWSGSWRDNHRYDWQQYRRHHSSLFRFGFYSDPYGFGYNRMRTGWSLWPSYFQSSFWLDDPWRYRLPPAYGSYRWVRYWDDALLVDTFTGEVVDVVYNFFW